MIEIIILLIFMMMVVAGAIVFALYMSGMPTNMHLDAKGVIIKRPCTIKNRKLEIYKSGIRKGKILETFIISTTPNIIHKMFINQPCYFTAEGSLDTINIQTPEYDVSGTTFAKLLQNNEISGALKASEQAQKMNIMMMIMGMFAGLGVAFVIYAIFINPTVMSTVSNVAYQVNAANNPIGNITGGIVGALI